jgi:hypothetical protein
MDIFGKLAVVIVFAWLNTLGTALAVNISLIIDSGPNIKTELFRSGGTSTIIWEEIAFTFSLPESASGDGIFHMFAGGDLNNLNIDRIDVTAGPFLGRTLLGTFAFPISDTHFTACENPPHSNPASCPVPETVPGGMFFDPDRGPGVGNVQGRRNTSTLSAGTPGLVVPQSLLVGGTNLTVSLFPRNDIFDLYIDRLELSFPIQQIPEPPTWWLVLAALSILGFAVQSGHRSRLSSGCHTA